MLRQRKGEGEGEKEREKKKERKSGGWRFFFPVQSWKQVLLPCLLLIN